MLKLKRYFDFAILLTFLLGCSNDDKQTPDLTAKIDGVQHFYSCAVMHYFDQNGQYVTEITASDMSVPGNSIRVEILLPMSGVEYIQTVYYQVDDQLSHYYVSTELDTELEENDAEKIRGSFNASLENSVGDHAHI